MQPNQGQYLYILLCFCQLAIPLSKTFAWQANEQATPVVKATMGCTVTG